MALVTQSNNAVTDAALAPFTGVNNGSARLLKAISATELAILQDGDTVYVESVRDYWKWVPTSTATDDCTGAAAKLRYCNPTVNGVNPGRFERLFICSPDWLLQNWFLNTGVAGHNENDGSTALTPLNNDTEITQRFGPGRRAVFATAVTITYAQTPAQQTNILFETVPGGSLTIVGTPTVTKAGTVLTAVQTQVRTPGAELGWAITGVGLGAADLDKVPVITASAAPGNVGAYSMALKDEGGGKLRVAPFGTFSASTGLFTQITPLVGDTIEIRDMTATTLLLGKIEGHCTSGSTANAPASGVTFDSVHFDLTPGASFGGNLLSYGMPFFYARCTGKVFNFGGVSTNAPTQHFWRGGGFVLSAAVSCRGTGQTVSLNQIGCRGTINTRAGVLLLLSTDCYFQNGAVLVSSNGIGGMVQSTGCAFFDRTTSNQAISIGPGGVWTQAISVPDWGTANAGHGIFIQSTGIYTYAVKPTVNGTLGAGREAQIGGTDVLYAATPYIEGANNAALVLTA